MSAEEHGPTFDNAEDLQSYLDEKTQSAGMTMQEARVVGISIIAELIGPGVAMSTETWSHTFKASQCIANWIMTGAPGDVEL